jgi:hypothetical protein
LTLRGEDFKAFLPGSITLRGKEIPIGNAKQDFSKILIPAIVVGTDGVQAPWDGRALPGTPGLSLTWPSMMAMGLVLLNYSQLASGGPGDIDAVAMEQAIKLSPELIEIIKDGVKIIKGEVTKMMNPKTMFRAKEYTNEVKKWKVAIIAKQVEIDKVVKTLRTLQKEQGDLLARRNAALKALDPQHVVTRRSPEAQLQALGISGLVLTSAGDVLASPTHDESVATESAADRVNRILEETE